MTPQDSSIESEQLLKVVDVARILNISRAFSYRLLRNGDIPSIKINSTIRVRPQDLEAYIQRCLDGSSSYIS